MSENSNKKLLGVGAMASICIGYTCTINNVTLGAELGTHMTFVNAIITMIIGYIIISAMTVANCMIGTKEHTTGKEIWCHTFGSAGGRIPSIVVAVCMIIFAFFDFWYVGDVFKKLIPIPHVGFAVGMVVIVLCAIIGSFWGTKSLAWLTRCLIPFAIGLMVALIAFIINRTGGMAPILATQPESVMPIREGVNVFLGGFLICVGLWPDLTMDAKNTKCVAIAVPAGLLMFLALFILGMFGAVGLGAYGIAPIAVSLGGALFVLTNIFVIFAQASTIPSNTHMIVTELRGNFHRIPAPALIICEPIFAALMSFVIEYGFDISILSTWAGTTGVIFAPIAGVTIAEYWVVNGGKFRFTQENRPKFCPVALIVAAVGIAVGAYLTYVNPILPASVTSFVLTFVLQIIFGKMVAVKQPA